jgi:hypothetical protein
MKRYLPCLQRREQPISRYMKFTHSRTDRSQGLRNKHFRPKVHRKLQELTYLAARTRATASAKSGMGNGSICPCMDRSTVDTAGERCQFSRLHRAHCRGAISLTASQTCRQSSHSQASAKRLIVQSVYADSHWKQEADDERQSTTAWHRSA